MSVNKELLATLQKAGAAVFDADAQLKLAVTRYGERVQAAVASNPFHLGNDTLFENWKLVARLSQTVAAMEEDLKNVYQMAGALSDVEPSLPELMPALSAPAPGASEQATSPLSVDGSLGAKALNEIVPQALALLPPAHRPEVIHQSGARQIEALRANYAAAGVLAQLTPFIDDTAQAFADADLVICRAGASTVTELAAVGAAALFVPFPSAVDDHQTINARFLVDQGAGWLVPQSRLTPQSLAELLQKLDRPMLLEKAMAAKKLQKLEATQSIVEACEALSK